MVKPSITKIIFAFFIIGGILMLTGCETQPQIYTLKLVTASTTDPQKVVEYPYTIKLEEDTFTKSSTVFSPEIAKISMLLSASANDSETVMQNLDALGFSHKAKFNYHSDYSKQDVGMAVASGQKNDHNIVMIVLRGTYKQEWYSNFDIGTDYLSTNNHKGFSDAADFVLDKLEMYMNNYSIDSKNTKFIVTGHSRGGAVANLVSASLINSYNTENVYAYTFATPNTTTNPASDDIKYSSIFNFVNPQDFIAYIPLDEWGFTKYGTTITFPSADTDDDYENKLNTASMYYKKYTGNTIKTFDNTDEITTFLNNAYRLAPTVDDYYNKKYEITGLKMSLYDYMMTVAYILNNENVITNGLIILSSESTEFGDITKFLLSGMNPDGIMFELNYDDALIGHAHAPQTYLSWLDTYIENM